MARLETLLRNPRYSAPARAAALRGQAMTKFYKPKPPKKPKPTPSRPTPPRPPGPPAFDPYAPLSPDEITQRAQSDVYGPYNDIIDSAVAALVGRAALASDTQKQRTSALVEALKPYAGRITGYFDKAAGDVSQTAGRLAGGLTTQGEGLATELGAKLAQINAPGAQQKQVTEGARGIGEGAAGAVGALGAAETEMLHGVGKAASDYAGAQPGIAQLEGLKQLGLIREGLSDQLIETVGELQIEASREFAAALKDYRGAELDKAKARDERAYRAAQLRQEDAEFRLAQAKEKHDQAVDRANLKLANKREAARAAEAAARIAQGNARIAQADARLNQQAAEAADRSKQAWARIGISDRNSQIAASRNELQWQEFMEDKKKAARNGGVTPAQAQRFRRDAGKIASRAWNGVSTTQTDENGETVRGKVHMTYNEALREGVAQGIPLSVMQRALNAYWSAPGMHAPWEQQGQGRPNALYKIPRRPEEGGGPRGKGSAAGKAAYTLPTSWKPTHVTDGLDWGTRTAVDLFPGGPGTPVGAPVSGRVVYFNPTGAQGGGSMEFLGDDGNLYWIGHIAEGAAAGTRLLRGQTLAVVSGDHPRPHVHIDRRRYGRRN